MKEEEKKILRDMIWRQSRKRHGRKSYTNERKMRRSVYEIVWEENAFGWVNLVRKLSLLTATYLYDSYAFKWTVPKSSFRTFRMHIIRKEIRYEDECNAY